MQKAISTAKTACNEGKPEDTHFALQQAIQETDLIIGQEVLKSLPFKMDDCTDTPILALANTIPLQQIAKLIQ